MTGRPGKKERTEDLCFVWVIDLSESWVRVVQRFSGEMYFLKHIFKT